MPDTKMALTGCPETAMQRSPIGRQPVIAIAGQAFAGTGISSQNDGLIATPPID